MPDDLWQDLVNAEAQARKETLVREPYAVDAYRREDGTVWVRLEHAQQVVRFTHDEAWRQGQWEQMKVSDRFWSARLVRRTQIVILFAAGIASIGFILIGYFSQ